MPVRDNFWGAPHAEANAFSVYRKTNRKYANGNDKWERVGAPGTGGVREFVWAIEERLTAEFLKSFGTGVYFCKWFYVDDRGKTHQRGKGITYELESREPETSEAPANGANGAAESVAFAQMLGLDAKTFAFFEFMDRRSERAAEKERQRFEMDLRRREQEFEHARKRDLDYWAEMRKLVASGPQDQITALSARLTEALEQIEGEESEDGEAKPWQSQALNEVAGVANKLVDVISKKLGDLPDGDDDDDDDDAGTVDTEGEASAS